MRRFEQLSLFDDAPYNIGRLVLPTALEIQHYGIAEHDPFIDDLPTGIGDEMSGGSAFLMEQPNES